MQQRLGFYGVCFFEKSSDVRRSLKIESLYYCMREISAYYDKPGRSESRLVFLFWGG